MTGLASVALLVGWLAATGGRVRWLPLILASIGVVTVVPLLFYPFAKTLWAASTLSSTGPTWVMRGGIEAGRDPTKGAVRPSPCRGRAVVLPRHSDGSNLIPRQSLIAPTGGYSSAVDLPTFL
ncbi:MAG: hypothetical protein ACRDHO_16760 [Actinomycetota bacterium]